MAAVLKQDLPRGLIGFWIVIITIVAAGIGYLQYLGPPMAAAVPAHVKLAAAPAPLKLKPLPHPAVLQPAPTGMGSAPPKKTPVPPPASKLLTTAASNPKPLAPQINPAGAPPIQPATTASLPAPEVTPSLMPGVPRIAIMVSGLGDDDTLSLLAASLLPPEISFALSPYGKHLQVAAAAARANGHEMLLVLPMPGLIAKAPVAQNQAMLDWSLSKIQGYIGVTDAYGPAMGGGFMGDKAATAWLMSNLAHHGLFFIDGNPVADQPQFAWGRSADVVIDAGQPDNETSQMALLVTEAEAQHAALGILIDPTPEALQAVADWSKSLVNQDIQLVPVSALVQPPQTSLVTQASTSP